MTGVPTPALDGVLALVMLRARIAGLYGDSIRPARDTEKAAAFA